MLLVALHLWNLVTNDCVYVETLSVIQLANVQEGKLAVRGKRLKNFWEPIHDPETPDDFTDFDWNFKNNNGPNYCNLNLNNLSEFKLISQINFSNCDFEGENREKIVFQNCHFVKCDLGSTKFRKVKFTNCSFDSCSFSLSVFHDSEFRDCDFHKIGLSGNETILEKTLITNPEKFIRSAYTKVDNLPKNVSKFKQIAKLEETKSTLSRIILANLHKEGSETQYYNAVKISIIQESRAKIFRALLQIHESRKKGRIKFLVSALLNGTVTVGGIIDLLISYVFGGVNAWGASLARPALAGIIICVTFAILYATILQLGWSDAVKRSIEVMFLFGYTNHAKPTFGAMDSYITLYNALVGVAWYVISVPTVVNKLTRVRN